MIETSHKKDTSTTKKVLLANGHRLFRRGLKEMLSSVDEDIEVLGEAQAEGEAVKLAGELEPDVVVLDAEEPSVRKRITIERLLEASPTSGLVVVALQDGSAHSIRQLLSQGVSAYVDANASYEDLVAAVHAAAYSSRSVGSAILAAPKTMLAEQEGVAKYGLTRRELEVLTLAASGLPNRQIAHDLRVAEGTVKRHLANLYSKLGVGSRSEATRKAFIEGWLTVQDLAQEARDQGND
jgi:DNA-binding NarL/FixJ family response regulator